MGDQNQMLSDDDRPRRGCSHVHAAPDCYTAWFTGEGTQHFAACDECAKAHPRSPQWVDLDDAWYAAKGSELYCTFAVGSPGVRTRAFAGAFEHQDVQFEVSAEVVDVQPNLGSASEWYVLLAGGELGLLDVETAQVRTVLPPLDLGFEVDEQCGLCVSPAQDFAVIYQASGSLGAVLDLHKGSVVRSLQRGSYRPENSLFPVALFLQKNRTLLVAGSDWNRLELIDLTDDRVLSERPPVIYDKDKRPEHYLDYFHGSLAVSPGGSTIADAGWIWHPVGVVRAWSVQGWLQNPWESEDGPSLRTFASRDYFWDGPMCWIDDHTLAVWGWGDDDEWLVPGVVLVDVQTGKVVRWFAGPKVRHPKAWPPRTLADSLIFDGYLYAVSDEEGTSVWDIATGARLLEDASMKPIRYHRVGKEFLSLVPGGVRRSRLVERS
jgi:hypothetical protein